MSAPRGGTDESAMTTVRLCSRCSAAWPDRPSAHDCPEMSRRGRPAKRLHDAALMADGATAERERLAEVLVKLAGRVKHGSAALLNAAADMARGRL